MCKLLDWSQIDSLQTQYQNPASQPVTGHKGIKSVQELLEEKNCWQRALLNNLHSTPKRLHSSILGELYRGTFVKCITHCWVKRLMRSSLMLIARIWRTFTVDWRLSIVQPYLDHLLFSVLMGTCCILERKQFLNALWNTFTVFPIDYMSSMMK